MFKRQNLVPVCQFRLIQTPSFLPRAFSKSVFGVEYNNELGIKRIVYTGQKFIWAKRE
jgi:hypothetical protein